MVVRRRRGAVDGVDDRHCAEERQRNRVAGRDRLRQLRREVGVGRRRGRRRKFRLLAARGVEQRLEVGIDVQARNGDAGDEAAVSFEDDMSSSTTVRFKAIGNYKLQLVATDGERTSYSDPVDVEVQPIGIVINFR
ncbi:MAG: hypothetical protein IJL06_02725 [Kiritimatiellae bacterium]|nr:hypothetical protein [Kiritimatiellia bacterium]